MYLAKNSLKLHKILKQWQAEDLTQVSKEFVEGFRRFKTQVSYQRVSKSSNFFDRKSFSAMMIKDDPIVMIPSYIQSSSNAEKSKKETANDAE